MVNANRDQLRHSAQTKMGAARALVGDSGTHPVPAVYLCHVALECALKFRILIMNSARDLEGLRRYLQPHDFDALFSGTTGHNLHRLQETAALRRFLVACDNESLLSGKEWGRMGGDRPYSLRYGPEPVRANHARSDVRVARTLTELILQQTA